MGDSSNLESKPIAPNGSEQGKPQPSVVEQLVRNPDDAKRIDLDTITAGKQIILRQLIKEEGSGEIQTGSAYIGQVSSVTRGAPEWVTMGALMSEQVREHMMGGRQFVNIAFEPEKGWRIDKNPYDRHEVVGSTRKDPLVLVIREDAGDELDVHEIGPQMSEDVAAELKPFANPPKRGYLWRRY